MKRYPEYKESGVEWLGKVPAEWKVVPLKFAASHNDDTLDETTPPETEILYVDISGVDGQLGIVGKEPLTFGAAPSRARRQVKHGDTIVSTVRTYLRAIAPVRHPEENLVVSTGFAVIRPRSELVPEFVGYLLSASYFIEQVIARSTGVSYPAINASDLVRIPVVVPSHDEQAAIAEFLDRETGKIDALVAEQRRLIELLKEKRQAVISHAVTKGLNPDAALKPSGIDWLGDVPEHWEVKGIKRIVQTIEQGWSPQCEGEAVDSFDQWGVLKVGCVNSGSFNPSENKRLPDGPEPDASLGIVAGDLLVSRANTRELVGRAAVASEDFRKLLLCDKLYRLRLKADECGERFLCSYLASDVARGQIELGASGASASMVNISQSVILELGVPLPPLPEQTQIIRFLDECSRVTVELISKAEEAIRLLQERRTALISAAVTGKIDVRNNQPVTIREHKPFSSGFARQLLAAEILSRHGRHPTMGRVKLQKLIHLCEYVAEIPEIHGTYKRDAAGPFDNKLMRGVALNLEKAKWFRQVKKEKRAHYEPMEKVDEHKKYLVRWNDKLPVINEVLRLLGEAKTQQCEIVATLYGAWNDLLIDGKTPTDAEIIREASDSARWHASKAEIPPEKWVAALPWMRKKKLIPRGFGAHTQRASAKAAPRKRKGKRDEPT